MSNSNVVYVKGFPVWNHSFQLYNMRMLMYACMLVAVPIQLVNMFIANYGVSFTQIAITQIITVATVIFMVEKVYAGRRWARIIFTTLFVLGMLLTIPILFVQWSNKQYLTVLFEVVYCAVQYKFLRAAYADSKVISSNYWREDRTFA